MKRSLRRVPLSADPMCNRMAPSRFLVNRVTTALLLVVAVQVSADIEKTAFYRTAKEVHIADVRRVENLITDQYGQINPPDVPDRPSQAEIDEFIDIVIERASRDDQEVLASLSRIRLAADPNDLFSTGVVSWLRNLLLNWQDFMITPENPGDYLPRPYSYHNKEKTKDYFTRERGSLIRSTEPRFNPQIAKTEPIPYYVPDRHDSPLDSQTFAVEIVDYLIERALREVLTRAFENTLSELADLSDVVQSKTLDLWASVEAFTKEERRSIDLGKLVIEFRSAVVSDVQALPARLTQGCTESQLPLGPYRLTGVRPSRLLCELLASLDEVQKGMVPALALSHAIRVDGNCDPVTLVGLVAEESYHSSAIARSTTIGGFSARSIRRYEGYAEQLLGDGGCTRYRGKRDLMDEVFSRLDVLRTMVMGGRASAGDSVPVNDVLSGAIEILDVVIESDDNEGELADRLRLWLQVYDASRENRFTDAARAVFRYVEGMDRDRGTESSTDSVAQGQFERLVELAANLAEASDATEVGAAVEAFAGPIGTFAAKRRPYPYVMVGAYLGARVGRQWPEANLEDPGNDYLGLALPVGLEIGVGFDRESRCCSGGIFISPFDLGRIAEYRVSGEPVEEVELQSLFSPGLFVVFGFFRDFPLAVAAGVQYTPAIEALGANHDRVDELRASVMLAIDVSLFQF